MVVDTSALLAIVLGEPDAELYRGAIAAASRNQLAIYIPASVLVEAGIIADRRAWGERLDQLIEGMQAEIVPVDRAVAEVARKAFRRFGRGRHQAALNFGDCLSYAVARHLHLPLLYKGSDFSQTDVMPAIR